MADSFKFELVSPERLLVSEEVSQVLIPGAEGEMTVMPDHAPVMTTVRPGIVTITTATGAVESYVVFGGFADVLPTGCTLLAESAVHVDEANREDIRARIESAREAMQKVETEKERADLAEYLHQLTTLENTMVPGQHLV
ncbi:MAG TPA: F0F1 ATP synthase subunit epsilon [Pararhizobium sp.]|nr:F0F1 ATP synthase subunit epsilon [Pararhizobium sp.]